MPLSWNEIRHRAIAFSKDWTGVKRESAEKQTFWNDFFNVFGVPRRAVATFEEPVKKLSGEYGFIDLFWPGKVLVEHKSAGKDLGKAEAQAFRYIQALVNQGRMYAPHRFHAQGKSSASRRALAIQALSVEIDWSKPRSVTHQPGRRT